MADINYLDLGSLVLVIVGALNWGLVGLGELSGAGGDAYNLVHLIAQTAGVSALSGVIYLLVGLAGLYQLYFGYELYQNMEE